ncbi:MAG: AgmX/PglI C-terminal domain-containing protein [Gammaproteobacteria bacterium]|nr:AgmX/PglI C-terminal domain-containing protein [Gammaproteobacteria bacterium]
MDALDHENPEFAEQERLLRQKVEKSERVLAELESDLREVDAELERLAQQSQQFEVLGQVCRSLEELESIGATALFWGDEESASREQLDRAHRHIDEYGASIVQVEERRQIIVEKIGDQNLTLDYLHYDLSEAIEREENRRAEWLVERDGDEVPTHVQVMPWARGYEEDQRFRKSLGTSLAASLLLAFLLTSIALPIIERPTALELPERMAKLVREELPPPPPPVPVEEPLIEEEPEPEPELAEEEPPPDLVPESAEEQAVAAAEPDVKEEVKSKGILAFRDSFASRASLQPAADLGSQARVRSAGTDAVGRSQRSMVTTNAPGSSGGINLASISRDVGGGGGQGMGGVEVARVSSSIGTGGTGNRPLAGGASAGRTDEEIQIVFDRYKAALYRLYNRELRKNPALRGQIILRLTIEPDGTVSFCTLQSSDMDAPALAQQVVDRVTTFDFGAKEDIVAVTIIYPIDFLPAA